MSYILLNEEPESERKTHLLSKSKTQEVKENQAQKKVPKNLEEKINDKYKKFCDDIRFKSEVREEKTAYSAAQIEGSNPWECQGMPSCYGELSKDNSKELKKNQEFISRRDAVKQKLEDIYKTTKDFLNNPFFYNDKIPEFETKNKKMRTDQIRDIALYPDQSNMALGMMSGNCYIYFLEEDRFDKLYFSEAEAANAVLSVAYSPRGNELVCGKDGGQIIVFTSDDNNEQNIQEPPFPYRFKQHECIKPNYDKHNTKYKSVRAVGYSRDGEIIISGGDDGNLRFYRRPQHKSQGAYVEIKSEGDQVAHKGGLCAFALSPDDKKLITGGNDKMIKVFSFEKKDEDYVLSGGEEIICNFLKGITSHRGIVRSVKFSKDGKFFLSGSYDSTAKLFDSETNDELKTYNGHSKPVLAVDISPDNNFIITGCDDNKAILYDRESANRLAAFEGKDNDLNIRAVHFLGNGSILLTAGMEGVLNFYSVTEGKLLTKKDQRFSGKINCVDVSSDRKKILMGGSDSLVRVFDIENNFELRRLIGHDGEVFSVSFSHHAGKILSGGQDCCVKLWDYNSGVLLKNLESHSEYVNVVLFSPNPKYFVSAGADYTLNLYNALGEKIDSYPPNKNSEFFVNALLFCKRGELLIAGGSQENTGVVVIFDLKLNLQVMLTKYYSSANKNDKPWEVLSLAINNREDLLAVATKETKSDDDGRIYIYQLSNLKSIANDKFLIRTTSGAKTILFEQGSLNNLILVSNQQITRVSLQQPNEEKTLFKIANRKDESVVIIGAKCLENNHMLIFRNDGKYIYDKIENLENNLSSDSLFQTEIMDLSINQDGNVMVGCTDTGEISLINPYTTKFISNLEKKPKELLIKAILFQDNYLIAAGSDWSLLVYDYAQSAAAIYSGRPDDSNNDELVCISAKMTAATATNTNGTYTVEVNQLFIFAGGKKGKIKLWKFSAEQSLTPIVEAHEINTISGISVLALAVMYEAEPGLVFLHSCLKNGKFYSHSSFDPRTNQFDIKFLCVNYRIQINYAKPSPDNQKFIFFGEDNTVKIFDVKFKTHREFRKHGARVCVAAIFPDNFYAISADKSREMYVFEIDSGIPICRFELDSPILCLAASPSVDSIIIGNKSGLSVISQIFNTRTALQNFIKRMDFFKDSEYNHSEILHEELEFEDSNAAVYPAYFSLLNLTTIFEKQSSDSISTISELFYDESITKKRTLIINSIFREESITKTCPWAFWMFFLENQNLQVTDKQMILRKLVFIITHPDIRFIEFMKNKKLFIKMILSHLPSKLVKVLDSFWIKNQSICFRQYKKSKKTRRVSMKCFSEFCEKLFCNQTFQRFFLCQSLNTYSGSPTFPIILHSRLPLSSNDKAYLQCKYMRFMLGTDEEPEPDKNDKYLDCELSICKINLQELLFDDDEENPGQKKFFLSEFAHFEPEDEIFKSSLFRFIVNYFWNIDSCIGFRLYRKIILYIMFLAFICLNYLYFIPEREILSVDQADNYISFVILTFLSDILIAFSLVLIIIYRAYNKITSGQLTTFWFLLDVFVVIAGLGSSLCDINWLLYQTKDIENKAKYFSAIFFCLSWFKLIKYVRGFKKTSSLVRTLFQVSKDMFVYLLIILFMIVGMAFSTFLLQAKYESQDQWLFFQMFYYILLGDFSDYKKHDRHLSKDIFFIIFFLTTVYVVILMMNLLIAIIYSSFYAVQAKEDQTEIYEKLCIILERYNGLYENEKKVFFKSFEKLFYIVEIRKMVVNKVKDDTDSKIKNIEHLLENMDKEAIKARETVNLFPSKFEKLDKNYSKLSMELQLFEKKITKIEEAIDKKMNKINEAIEGKTKNVPNRFAQNHFEGNLKH